MSRSEAERKTRQPQWSVGNSVEALNGRRTWRWHMATSRWLTTYALVFALSFMALVGLLEYSVDAAMNREIDSGIRWQLRYYDSVSDEDLAAAIKRKLEHEKGHVNYYGLFAPDGRRIVGDIETLPAGLRLVQVGQTLASTMGATRTLTGDPSAPTLRLLGVVRENGSRLVVGRRLADVEAVRGELNRAVIGGGLLCIVASIAVGLLIGLRQARRVSGMQRVTARIASGELAQRLPAEGRDELAMLAHLVNHMLDEVERLMNEVKGACDGIAHDLRTPLVRLRVHLAKIAEIAGESGDGVASQMISRVRSETDSILVRFSAMLRISEISGMQRRSAFEVISFESLVDELCELYRPLAEERSIELSLRMDPVAPLHADRALLFEAFSNLFDNAIKFSPDGGKISVELWASCEGAQFVISDNGPGIPVSERHAVLGRFYRGEQTKHVSGAGLGLGIVAAILHLHDFAMRIGGDERGATITVDCWPHHFH